MNVAVGVLLGAIGGAIGTRAWFSSPPLPAPAQAPAQIEIPPGAIPENYPAYLRLRASHCFTDAEELIAWAGFFERELKVKAALDAEATTAAQILGGAILAAETLHPGQRIASGSFQGIYRTFRLDESWKLTHHGALARSIDFEIS